jgi:hypothetical protein
VAQGVGPEFNTSTTIAGRMAQVVECLSSTTIKKKKLIPLLYVPAPKSTQNLTGRDFNLDET